MLMMSMIAAAMKPQGSIRSRLPSCFARCWTMRLIRYYGGATRVRSSRPLLSIGLAADAIPGFGRLGCNCFGSGYCYI